MLADSAHCSHNFVFSAGTALCLRHPPLFFMRIGFFFIAVSKNDSHSLSRPKKRFLIHHHVRKGFIFHFLLYKTPDKFNVEKEIGIKLDCDGGFMNLFQDGSSSVVGRMMCSGRGYLS